MMEGLRVETSVSIGFNVKPQLESSFATEDVSCEEPAVTGSRVVGSGPAVSLHNTIAHGGSPLRF